MKATELSIKREIAWRKEQQKFLKSTLKIGNLKDNWAIYLNNLNEIKLLKKELKELKAHPQLTLPL